MLVRPLRSPAVPALLMGIMAGSGPAQTPHGYLETRNLLVAQPAGIDQVPPGDGVPAGRRYASATLPMAPGGRLKREHVENRLVESFRRAFQQPRNLVVRIRCQPADLARGRFEVVDLGLEDGRLDILPLSFVQARFYDARVDMTKLMGAGEIAFMETPRADLRMVLGEEALNEALSRREDALRMREARLSLARDQITFSGRIKTFLMENRVTLSGHLQVRDGRFLAFEPSSLHLGPIPLPRTVLEGLADRSNPLFDLGRLRDLLGLEVSLETIEVQDHSLVVCSAGAAGWRPH